MTAFEHQVRMLSYDELDPAIIARWESLEERALEPNAYLSPCFVLPALSYLCSKTEVNNTVFIFVEQPKPCELDLAGVGVFVHSAGGLRFPLPHLRSFRSLHSYLSGFLLDRKHGEAALQAIFNFFCRNGGRWHGLDLACMPADGIQAELVFRVAREFGCQWHERERSTRSIFSPQDGGEAYLRTQLSAHRLKRLRQAWKRLEGKGKVEWRTVFGSEVTDSNVESFLELEHKGWKREDGKSLRSNLSHEAFFRELVNGFRRNKRLFFTELLLDGAVIASTSNLVVGNAGFAFKIGWDIEYADTSPGLLNEMAFVQRVSGRCRELTYVDSGAEEGSFIEHLWAGRRSLTHGTFSLTLAGRAALKIYASLRRFKVLFRRFQERRNVHQVHR